MELASDFYYYQSSINFFRTFTHNKQCASIPRWSKASKSQERVAFVWAFMSSVLSWHLNIQEALKAHQTDVSIIKAKHYQKVPQGQSRDRIIKGFFLPLTLKQLHIHLDVVSFPWWLQTDTSLPEEKQCHLFRRACVCAHTCQPVSTHKIFALILQWKSVSSSSLLCCFRLSRWESEIEKSTEAMTESHAQRQKHKEREREIQVMYYCHGWYFSFIVSAPLSYV